jgi:modification target Cys-rich repeat protein
MEKILNYELMVVLLKVQPPKQRIPADYAVSRPMAATCATCQGTCKTTCSGGCKNSCYDGCKGSCKGGCSRSCKGSSR